MSVKKLVFGLSLIMATGSNIAVAADTSDYMQTYRSAILSQGYSSNGFSRYDSLSAGEKETHTIYTTPGDDYVVAAVCDNDCSDIDLALLSNGTVIKTDYDNDDTPMLSFTAHSSSYTVRVDMEKCSSNPCYYRVEGFSK